MTNLGVLGTIVKANDIRGLVPDELNAPVAYALGMAAALVLDPDGAGKIIIGQDMRPSSPELVNAFAEGAVATGTDVVLIGLCSTDGLYQASGMLNAAGAMFTASHNPAEYNGIKICAAGALPVGLESGLAEIRDQAAAILAGNKPELSRAAGQITQRDTLNDYAVYLRKLVDLSGIRPLRVVVDAGNGMGGLTVPAVLGEAAGLPPLPLEIIPLYFELDGTFPNHPANPLEPENLRDLQRAVIEHNADVGLAFDGDADRCFVVDERGEPISPSAVTVLVGLREVEIERAAGREPVIIHNLITSQVVPEMLSEAGAQLVRSRVGHSFIKQDMARTGAVFGGEHSAHYYFRDFYGADSGMLAAMHLLAALGATDVSLSQLVADLQPYVASGEINSRVADVAAAKERVVAHLVTAGDRGEVKLDRLDGIFISHWHAEPRWWASLRASNTEPLLRLNVEAESESVMAQIRDEVLALVRSDEAASNGARGVKG